MSNRRRTKSQPGNADRRAHRQWDRRHYRRLKAGSKDGLFGSAGSERPEDLEAVLAHRRRLEN